MNKIKFILIIVSLIVFTKCKSSKEAIFEKRYKEAYINDFKIKYFRSLLSESFSHSNEIKVILKNDASKGLADPNLSMQDYQVIDSVVKIDNFLMAQDSARRDLLVRERKLPEGNKGKYVFTYALERYNSKWLDSLSKARYMINKKAQEN